MKIKKVDVGIIYIISPDSLENEVLEDYFQIRKIVDPKNQEGMRNSAWEKILKRYRYAEECEKINACKALMGTEEREGIDFYNLYQSRRLKTEEGEGLNFLS